MMLSIAMLVAADDGAMVRCALAKTPAAERTAMQNATLASVTRGTPPTSQTEALIGKLRGRAGECQPGSGAVDSRAGEIAVASLVVETLSNALQSQGVDVLAINARLTRTPPATLDALLAKKRSAEVGAMMTGLQAAAGPKGKTATVSRLLAGYAFNAARLGKLFKSTAG
ncbi:hypothetical protein [Sphingomonas sp. Leaf33]|uniref:hypothetical protein n=1 Tax=Sphingomonas sp. Leaf33 TaxID=1736215 RepID=UPI0012E1BC5A|nr:hypothetical protein [Sphingomonas sp. Leaf33]